MGEWGRAREYESTSPERKRWVGFALLADDGEADLLEGFESRPEPITIVRVRPPLAYFITWSCYGTWLPGDRRSSVDKAHNVVGTPRLDPDPKLASAASRRIKGMRVVPAPEARPIVDRAIRDHCEVRGWRLHALNVRSTHVHVVVTADAPPEVVMNQFKSWATRRLRKEGIVGAGQRVWTKHGSTRWLNAQKYVDLAIEYVRDRQ